MLPTEIYYRYATKCEPCFSLQKLVFLSKHYLVFQMTIPHEA